MKIGHCKTTHVVPVPKKCANTDTDTGTNKWFYTKEILNKVCLLLTSPYFSLFN